MLSVKFVHLPLLFRSVSHSSFLVREGCEDLLLSGLSGISLGCLIDLDARPALSHATGCLIYDHRSGGNRFRQSRRRLRVKRLNLVLLHDLLLDSLAALFDKASTLLCLHAEWRHVLAGGRLLKLLLGVRVNQLKRRVLV